MGKSLHARQMKVEAFELNDSTILVQGHLEDDMPFGYKHPGGERYPAGKLHNMSVEMEVSVPRFKITALRVHMPGVPTEDCRQVMPLMQSLVGTRIGRGFTSAVKERIGGVKGCAHILTLILAMAPSATMGYGAQQLSTGKEDSDHWLAKSHVLNSCYMFGEDGPYHKALKAEAAEAEKPNKAS